MENIFTTFHLIDGLTMQSKGKRICIDISTIRAVEEIDEGSILHVTWHQIPYILSEEVHSVLVADKYEDVMDLIFNTKKGIAE